MKKISGIVKRGKGKGKILGFPTANLDLSLEIEKGNKIESGVYEGCAYLYGAKCKAGIFVSKDGKTLELHIVGLEDNLYGKEIEIEIGERIRDVMDFKNDEDLKKQIARDIEVISNL